jgi:hypothetical protein
MTKPPNKIISLTELLGRPDKLAAAIEQERRAKSPPGWLGIKILAQPDWNRSFELGEGVQQVEVDPKSSPYRDAGMRTGDYLHHISANGAAGLPLDEFCALALPRGTRITLKYFRQGTGRASGWLLGEATLTDGPRAVKVPKWKKLAPVPCGDRVIQKDRSRFLNTMAQHRYFSGAMIRALTMFATRYDNDAKDGFWHSYATMADHLGYSGRHARRTVIRVISRLRWELTWPARRAAVKGAPPTAPLSTRKVWRI